MGMTPEQGTKIAEEAALWVQRLREQDTPEVRAEFSAWARQGTRNVEEFLFARAIWQELDGIDKGTAEKLRLGVTDDSVIPFPMQELPPPARSPRRAPLVRRLVAGLAATLVAVLAWTQLSPPDRSRAYATEVGEQKTLKLPDGSLIHLNALSRAEISFDAGARLVRLADGEALFTVAHDSQRPFIVLTDSARVRAVGTQFNVYRSHSAGTRVTVIEGVVQVSTGTAAVNATHEPASPTAGSGASASGAAIQLAAGDEAEIEHGRIQKADKPNVERAVSWTHRKLMFPGNELSEIVAQFNRYNDKPIRIEAAELESRRMSGVFDADDPTPLLNHLAGDPRLEIVYGQDAIVVRTRAP